MRVHIVVTGPRLDRILARMARYLVDGTGWTMSERPDERADLNYFLPYLEWSRAGRFAKTPIAAYFTHREPGAKGRLWDEAAAAMGLRIVTAEQYRAMLEPFGLTVRVPPPVDSDHFALAQWHRPASRPVVGVSGFVYSGGRKGESLVRELARRTADRYEWRAAGKGWPVPTRLYPWQQLPAFYGGLDAYLCAATIEGVPMPPLEALACGVPVVIPRGVGMLDDLSGYIIGVSRYEPGDADGALAAIEEVVGRSAMVNRPLLRSEVEDYTPQAWREAHGAAFDRVLNGAEARGKAPDDYGYVVPDLAIRTPRGPTILESLPARVPAQVIQLRPAVGAAAAAYTERAWYGHAGYYVVAYGGPARACAARLLESIGRYMPGVPVCLAGDEPLGMGESFVKIDRGDIGARSVKIAAYDATPADWRYVVYLDADTELVAPVPFLFDVLADGWEFTIAKNPSRFHVAEFMVRPDNKQECAETFQLWGTDQMMQWNGGVLGFRRCGAVERFFAEWQAQWKKYAKRDQAALLRALWKVPLRLYPLGNEWNLVPTYQPISRSAGIVHHVTEAREWGRGVIAARGDSPEAFRQVARVSGVVRGRTLRPVIVNSERAIKGRPARDLGPLETVEIRPGQSIRLRADEAARLRERIAKQRERAQDKMRGGLVTKAG